MRKNKLHTAAILVMLCDVMNNDFHITDEDFLKVIDEFNDKYRTKSTRITEEDVMNEMASSTRYEFGRMGNKWIVYPLFDYVRYQLKSKTTSDGYIMYTIIDTYCKKLIDIDVEPEFAERISKTYNAEFRRYNQLLNQFIFV